MAELRFNSAQRMSHAYIVSAQSLEESLRAAKSMAAAAICTGTGMRPCGVCRACRKAAADIHPDIISICRLTDDKGKLKQNIGVDQIREMSADACVLPNEAARKVYIIREADTMNLPAQNAALKLLEEPPNGVMFLLCTTKPMQLLPTVHSRCAEINMNGERETADGESMKLAGDFISAVASADPARLCRWCTGNEGLDSGAAAAVVYCAGELLTDMLCGRRPDLGMSKSAMLELSELLQRCGTYLRVYVGVKHIFGLLAVDSIAGGGNRG